MSITVETVKIVLAHLRQVVPDAVCRRDYDPIADVGELGDMEKPLLLVVPVERDAEKYDVGGSQKNEFEIDIAINVKLLHADDPEAKVAEIDGLVELAEKVFNAFLKRVERNDNGIRVGFDQPNHLVFIGQLDHHCFLSVIRISATVYDDRTRRKNQE